MGTALRYSLLWASTVFVSSCGSLLPSERAEVQSPSSTTSMPNCAIPRRNPAARPVRSCSGWVSIH